MKPPPLQIPSTPNLSGVAERVALFTNECRRSLPGFIHHWIIDNSDGQQYLLVAFINLIIAGSATRPGALVYNSCALCFYKKKVHY
jgi:hypothetical protein